MSLLFFAGFDNFGGAQVGGSGFGPEYPTKGAGLIGTPYETLLPITYGTPAGVFNSMGVTNAERFRIGAGAERRNMLITACGGTTSGHSALMKVGAGISYVVGQPFSLTLGLNLCDFSAANPVSGYFISRFCRNTASLANLIEHVGGTSQYRFAGNTNLYTFTRGEPVYVEFVIDVPTPVASGTNTFRCRVYVNGELFYTNNAYTTAPSGAAELYFDLGMDRSLSADRYIGFSDIYLLDNTGEAPFNDRLGPQIVLPYSAESVTADGWTLTGGTDPLTMLTDGLDSTYLTSPVAKGTLNVKANLNLGPGSQVNALAFFARISRDSGAPRQFSGTAKRSSDGVALGTTAVSATPALPGFVTAGKFYPNTVADRNLLNFIDTGKVEFTFTSEQPG